MATEIMISGRNLVYFQLTKEYRITQNGNTILNKQPNDITVKKLSQYTVKINPEPLTNLWSQNKHNQWLILEIDNDDGDCKRKFWLLLEDT